MSLFTLSQSDALGITGEAHVEGLRAELSPEQDEDAVVQQPTTHVQRDIDESRKRESDGLAVEEPLTHACALFGEGAEHCLVWACAMHLKHS